MEEKLDHSGNEDIDGNGAAGDNGWLTVKNRKKGRNKKFSTSQILIDNDVADNQNVPSDHSEKNPRKIDADNHNVLSDHSKKNPRKFDADDHNVRSDHSEKNLQKIDAQRSAPPPPVLDNTHGAGRDNDNTDKAGQDNGVAKKKGRKKHITLTPAQAAARIDAADVTAFIAKTKASYASQDDIQLIKVAEYFGQVFSSVNAAQFPWLKLFNDSSLDEVVDVPICHISKDVNRILAEWIDKHSDDGLYSFVIWSLNNTLSDITIQRALSKGTPKGAQNTSSKSQIVMFIMLSIVLRRRPGLLINFLSLLRDDPKYQGRDKIPLFSWMIAQAAEGDITVGLYVWSRHMLPLMGGKPGSNPKARDLVLQVVERIICTPNARKILSQGATRNGERLIPTSSLELLLRLSFPLQSDRVKATERFEALYPVLIYVALYGTPRGEELKQLSLQMLPLLLKLAGEENPVLSQEAGKLFIWCLIQNPDCCNHWGKMYVNNVKASVVILGRLSGTWNVVSSKLSDLSTLRIALKGFREKNKKACGEGVDIALVKEVDEHCRGLLRHIFKERYRWIAIVMFCIMWIAIGVAIFHYWF